MVTRSDRPWNSLNDADMKKENVLFSLGHPPMGDSIINNGLFREVLKRRPEVTKLKIATFGHYVNDVAAMYQDEERIQVYGVLDWASCDRTVAPSLRSKGVNSLLLSTWGPKHDPVNWCESPYKQTGIPYSCRWSSFKLSPHLFPRKPPGRLDVALVHEDLVRHMKADRKRLPKGNVVFITNRATIWYWLPHILAARELHCIDSCFLNLIDQLYFHDAPAEWGQGKLLQNTPLIYHKYARSSAPPVLRAPWKILT